MPGLRAAIDRLAALCKRAISCYGAQKYRDRHMIVTHLFGGLGNQLFQFATGKGLAERLGVELRLDARYFDKPRPDALCIHHFGHKTKDVVRKNLPAMRQDGLIPYIAAKLRGTTYNVFKETGLAYDPAFEALEDNTYLKGYWQSERYFRDQSDAVRASLAVVTPPTADNILVLKEYDTCFPVSLHVRRGDYVSNAKFNATHGTCDLDYYRRAADLVAERCKQDVIFYAFSDEPDWVRDNLRLPHQMRIVSHNGPEHNYEDIRLMSHCRHHIIANSSFSWWGAWLNPNADKMVVTPSRWFADPAMQKHDLLPPEWIRL